MSDLNEILDEIERKEKRASKGPWKVADSCSWRRIVGGVCGEGVIVPTKNTVDGHPDLIARRDDLEFAADSRTTVPALLKAVRQILKWLCEDCGGTGMNPETHTICKKCQGNGGNVLGVAVYSAVSDALESMKGG